MKGHCLIFIVLKVFHKKLIFSLSDELIYFSKFNNFSYGTNDSLVIAHLPSTEMHLKSDIMNLG